LDKVSFGTPLSSIIREDFVLESDYVTQKASIEDALSHRTGMAAHDISYGGSIDTAQKLVRNLRNLPLSYEFRTKHVYCNTMFAAACHALETTTSKKFGDYLHDEIWEPLDMKDTSLSLEAAREIEKKRGVKLAVGYRWEEGQNDFVAEDYMIMPHLDGAGGVISNVLDYAKWLQMLIKKNPPLSEEMHRDIIYPRVIDSDTFEPFTGPDTYALGWGVQVYKGHKIIMHNGGLVAFGASVVYLPDKQIGITMMANTRDTSNRLLQILTMYLLDEILEIPVSERFDFEDR
jgi:CubicO group peptidase (beta-lactamase class C family)